MKKMMFIAAIALCAMSCGNKACNAEAEAEEAAVVEEVVAEEVAEEAAPADSIEVIDETAEAVVEEVAE